MRILVDIGHPAHVHYFRNLADILTKKGSRVLFTTRDKEVAVQLLDHYGLSHVNFGRSFKSLIGKLWGLLWFTMRLFVVALKFKPDVYLNATQYSAMVAWILRKPHISLEDTFNFEQVRLFMPFTSAVLTGTYPHPDLGSKEIRYDGYQELAYLHPKRFSPDDGVLGALNLRRDSKFVVIRFISWNASHDFGSRRLSYEQKLALISALEKVASVFISSEAVLPAPLARYRLELAPHRIHDVLALASLYIGEGATMASESAMLGTPAIYINPQDVYTIREQESKYGLVYSFRDFEGVIEKSLELLETPGLKDLHIQRRDKMLAEKIDVTGFLAWFVENFPDSMKVMKEDPQYQRRFQ
jgi:predicted glycosyltransferase